MSMVFTGPDIYARTHSLRCISSDILEILAMEFWTWHASDNSLASLGSSQLLKNIQAAGLHIVASSEQPTALREDEFMFFDSSIDVSHVEAPSITRTFQETEAKMAKPTLGKCGRPIKD
ncbi:uncharacterized protein F5147DRAFT_840622 [Suillus discolor]|uniref:Uncharacterized protein n=1 Tax=Suillus discolor TaxID=1912936 RepID=A0A9P7EWQ9_9AGAM|nr:uncharacterized protein F5147DRAFT_840622 [Suillus discolor]KAG2092491.1 hypothetical protein F5147DRAFT_840622 [Suillus discolor]